MVMKLLPDAEEVAERLSAFIQKGGWLAGPLGGMAMLYLLQDTLVFNPVNTPPSVYRAGGGHRARAVTLTMCDGARLRGWWMRPLHATPSSSPALLYFGGRSEEVSWVSEPCAGLGGVHALFVNYRGYGHSQGKPSERNLLADALELYDWISAQPGVHARRVVVIGRSLGTGIAAYVASQRPAAAAILITPYDSIVELARRRFPYCAAQLLLRHRFDALCFASLAKAPALVLLAEHDSVIPKHHAMRLVDAWAGPKQVATIAGTDHCDVQAHSVSWQAISAFLKHQFGDSM